MNNELATYLNRKELTKIEESILSRDIRWKDRNILDRDVGYI